MAIHLIWQRHCGQHVCKETLLAQWHHHIVLELSQSRHFEGIWVNASAAAGVYWAACSCLFAEGSECA
jgi:hypothetical protein